MCGRRYVIGGRRGPAVGAPGVVLVITVLLVSLFLVMGMTMINLASSDYQVANNESRSIQALYNADAGVEEAKMRVSPTAPAANRIPIQAAASWRAYILSGQTQAAIQAGLDPNYSGAATNVFYNSVQTGANIIQWGWARIEHKLDGSGLPLYQHAVTGAETTVDHQNIPGSGDVNNPPILLVTAEGIQGAVRRMIQVEYQPIVSTTTTSTDVVTDPFSNAIRARGTNDPTEPAIELTGNAWTDSYDSRNGAYNVNGNIDSNGDLATGATHSDSIIINTNSTVNGDVYYGTGGTGATVSHPGTVNGSIGQDPAGTVSLPLTAIPPGTTNLGNLSISGNRTVTLSEGTYWYSSISITGNGQLVTTGAVKIYVTGSIDIGGNGVATAGNLPPNLLIYGTDTCTSVDIHGNGDFYGAVYAPNASVRVVGNGATYGSLVGDNVLINGNGGFHYDQALANLGRQVTTNEATLYSTTGYTRYSWREVAF